ncbi:MAG: 5-(carboxyamino)imidazole ribonucleotide synthase [Chloroherpetonaceae bacterium]
MKTITIGILGGGQLARMSAYAAFRFGMNVCIYERVPNSPASQVTPYSFVGEWSDKSALKPFADCASVITLENEFIAPNVLEYLESLDKPVFPTSRTIALVQDKLVQKETLRRNHLPVADFAEIHSVEDAEHFGRKYGYPFLLKSRTGGYDGYGNRTIHAPADIPSALSALGFPSRTIMAEAFVKFEKELATIVARTRDNAVKVYPIVETIQENHICKTVKAPAEIGAETEHATRNLAQLAIESIDGVGVFGVEMFVTADGRTLINELAPRPHNSGHYTIDACLTSQFENHIRAILNYPLGDVSMLAPAAVMVNVLGKTHRPVSLDSLPLALRSPSVKIHLYGKAESRIGRKMGHITAIGDRIADCLKRALDAESALTI